MMLRLSATYRPGSSSCRGGRWHGGALVERLGALKMRSVVRERRLPPRVEQLPWKKEGGEEGGGVLFKVTGPEP